MISLILLISVERQPQNSEFRNNLKTFTHALTCINKGFHRGPVGNTGPVDHLEPFISPVESIGSHVIIYRRRLVHVGNSNDWDHIEMSLLQVYTSNLIIFDE